MIVGIIYFFALVRNARVKDKLDSLLYEPCDMTMGKLGRVTFGFTRYGLYAKFIYLTA